MSRDEVHRGLVWLQAPIRLASATRPNYSLLGLGHVQNECHVFHLLCLLKLHERTTTYLLFDRLRVFLARKMQKRHAFVMCT
jgi:hypothetical protein